MEPLLKRHTNRLWVVGILLILAANIKLFSTYKTVPWDAFDEMFYYFRWLGSALRQGYFPDFFPNIMSGYPIGSNIQVGVYNIFYLAFAFAFPDSVLSINMVYLTTQMVIFGLGYAIGKTYHFNTPVSIYFGLALTASGFVIGHASHLSYLATACGLLGSFLGLRLALAERGTVAFTIVFVSVYHMFTAGYPANILFGAQCFAVYWVYLFITIPSSRRALLIAAAGAISGVLVSAPAILHFLNLLQLSPRGDGLDIDTVLRGSLPGYSVLNFFYPAWEMRYSEPTMERFHLLFISGPLILYAVWNAVEGKDRTRILILLSIALLLLLLALGKNSPIPLRMWLAENFFIYRTGRFPSGEHRGIALFFFALISAFGLQQILAKWPKKMKYLLAIIMLDFLVVMSQLKPMRIGGMPDEYKGNVPLFQAHFDASTQPLLDTPRDCRPDGPNWTLTALNTQRGLAPDGFYWNGYVGLRDQTYDLERDQSRDILCGPSRLWHTVNHKPFVYKLVTYTPGYIKFKISGDSETGGVSEFVWADYNDGLWNLEINGQPSTLTYGPARTRAFMATPGDVIEMTYAGPLSRLWRR